MPTLYLVRHGRAAARYDEDHDPGLDDIGRRQAQAAADRLAPLGRCRS
jgi:broad specificity phosphatase PhoE